MPANKAISAVRSCREYGKQQDYASLLIASDSALKVLQMDSDVSGIASAQSVGYKACVLGYKGFALLKLNRHAEALPLLEEAQSLREKGEKLRLRSRSAKKPPDRPLVANHAESTNWFLRSQEGQVVKMALKECYTILGKEPPLPALIKYPRTTHLFDSGGTATTADDLVLPDLSSVMMRFCRPNARVLVEEKVDGANLGVSLCPYSGQIFVQNRSHYISKGEHVQFNRIPEWIETFREVLTTKILQGGNRILYGEWVTARHSIPYQKLPGWFIAFDLYDKTEEKYWNRKCFHTIMKGSGIAVVPVLTETCFAEHPGAPKKASETSFRKQVIRLLESKSAFRSDGGTVEGIVMRLENDEESPWVQDKYKVVRPDFLRGCDGAHWSSRTIEKQQVDFEFQQEYLKHCYICAASGEANCLRKTN